MVRAGELRERIEVLRLDPLPEGGGYEWTLDRKTWAKAVKTGKRALYAANGKSGEEYAFTLRRQPLTLHEAIRWQGRFYLLYDLTQPDRGHIDARCAAVWPVTCTVQRERVSTANPLNRPQTVPQAVVTFPAVLTEKYVKAEQPMPQTTIETTLLLVTPKPVELATGEVVTVGTGEGALSYCVQIGHRLDTYRNEYEIVRTEDA